jgi:hypothetical protein
MECDPTAKPEVAKLATPPLNVPFPRLVELSQKVTVPVAADGVTTAVKVTGAPDGAGFVDEERLTEDACLTVCVSLEEVLVL